MSLGHTPVGHKIFNGRDIFIILHGFLINVPAVIFHTNICRISCHDWCYVWCVCCAGRMIGEYVRWWGLADNCLVELGVAMNLNKHVELFVIVELRWALYATVTLHMLTVVDHTACVVTSGN